MIVSILASKSARSPYLSKPPDLIKASHDLRLNFDVGTLLAKSSIDLNSPSFLASKIASTADTPTPLTPAIPKRIDPSSGTTANSTND